MSRRAALLFGDLVSVVVIVGLLALHAARHNYSIDTDARLLWTFAYVAMLLVAIYAVGLPGQTGRRGPLVSAVLATGAAAVGTSVIQLVVGSALLPRFVVFAGAGLLTAFWTFLGMRIERQESDATRVARVMLVASKRDADTLGRDLASDPEHPTTIVATYCVSDMRPIGPADEPLVDAAIEHDVSVLVLGREAQAERLLVAQASTLHESGVRVRTLAQFYEEWLGKLPVSELERTSLMFDISEVHVHGYARVKRLLDVVIAVAGLLPLLLAVPFVFVGNLLGNRGPLFFRQSRVGRDGVPFPMIKFRTMRESPSQAWTEADDPRVTRFGRVLRRTHVDELPQFLNILRGQLSIVGPRPEQPQYVEHLIECLPYYKLRHLVRPGLTGWAQVKYGYAASEADALEKLQFDFYYLRHQSMVFDLRVIARTTRRLVRGGAR
jgi:lipopolysaccharide/colanic/teichoic acid biosynthesis glycosyltransferase